MSFFMLYFWLIPGKFIYHIHYYACRIRKFALVHSLYIFILMFINIRNALKKSFLVEVFLFYYIAVTALLK